MSQDKEKVIIAGIPISLAALGIATGAFKKAYNGATKAMREYFKLADPSIKDLETVDVKLVKGGTAIKTHLDIDGLGSWWEKAAAFMIEYNGAVQAKNVEAITTALGKLESLMDEFNNKKGFTTGKAQEISADNFRNSYDKMFKACAKFYSNYTCANEHPDKVDDTFVKGAGSKFETQTSNVQRWNKLSSDFQFRLVALGELVDGHVKEFEGIEEDLNVVSKKFGFSGIIDGAKNLISKIKEKFSGNNTTTTESEDSDDSFGSPKVHGDAEANGGVDTTVPGTESATITIVDEDYVQEGVTRTGKTAKVEESAKTAGDVDKLIKKYISNVDKKGFSNEKKMLLIIGDSKIKYDNSKIKKPGKDETWDDVDMSAHDHVDKVKLYISGPGALAYAKDNGIGKAKEIQESVLPEEDETTEDVVTTESAYTSWYN